MSDRCSDHVETASNALKSLALRDQTLINRLRVAISARSHSQERASAAVLRALSGVVSSLRQTDDRHDHRRSKRTSAAADSCKTKIESKAQQIEESKAAAWYSNTLSLD